MCFFLSSTSGMSLYLQLVQLTGFLHPVVKKMLDDQSFPSEKGGGKAKLEDHFHTGRFRWSMNVPKGVEILGEAVGSKWEWWSCWSASPGSWQDADW